jgi:protein-tyrosine phosphatase
MRQTDPDTLRRARLAARLDFPRLLNARELGGCAVRSGGSTRMRSVLRTDDLWRLTPEGVKALVDYGVRSIIDLLWPRELERRPSVFQRGVPGVRYTNVSILDGSEQAWIARTPLVSKEWWSVAVLDHSAPDVARVLRAVADAPAGAVVLHCAAGKDRTGAMAALLLAAADAEPPEIAEDYSISTEYIRDAYLAAHPREEWDSVLEDVRCPPEQVYNMLDHLQKQYGGVRGYMKSLGLDAEEIRRVCERLAPGGAGR